MTEPAVEIKTTTAAQSAELLLSGDMPDVKNRYGSGTIRVSEVRLTYRNGAVLAQIYGCWRKPGGELTDAVSSQRYTGPLDEWPDWLAALARRHEPPAMTNQPAADEVRQVLVHPAVWPHLEAWLAQRRIVLALMPPAEDDLPTYVMTLTDAAAETGGAR